MRIRIKDREYDPRTANDATLWDLRELQSQTGLGLPAIQNRLQAVSTLPEEEQAEAMFAPENLTALMALIWLLRRRAGERLTLEEATGDFAVHELSIVGAEDEDGEPVPKGGGA